MKSFQMTVFLSREQTIFEFYVSLGNWDKRSYYNRFKQFCIVMENSRTFAKLKWKYIRWYIVGQFHVYSKFLILRFVETDVTFFQEKNSYHSVGRSWDRRAFGQIPITEDVLKGPDWIYLGYCLI